MKNQNVKLDNIAFIGPKQFENFTKARLFELCTLKWLQLCSFQLNRFIELAINSGKKPWVWLRGGCFEPGLPMPWEILLEILGGTRAKPSGQHCSITRENLLIKHSLHSGELGTMPNESLAASPMTTGWISVRTSKFLLTAGTSVPWTMAWR